VTLETSPESPAPLRTIANAIAGWVHQLGAVWVEGQIAEVKRRPGLQTVFITLRDSVADISMAVTCTRAVVDSLDPPLAEGASVVVHGKPSYYANRGTISLQAREIRMVGLGELLARIERLRQRLAAEGLFSTRHKKNLPFLPRCVGLVTAPGSAAERDVLENARRRWPSVRFEVAYATMQGPKSAGEVIEALGRLDRNPEVDVVVISRGGGSIEDLLPFSDESLVRAVFAATTPVVSAIGHEPDSPLLDLVADYPASTPTDAAKRVVPDVAEELRRVDNARQLLRGALDRRLSREQAVVENLRSRPALADPRSLLDERAHEVTGLRDRARRCFGHQLDRATDDIGHQRARARALSPRETLRRGYSVLQDEDGRVLTSVAGASVGQSVSIRLADGRLHAAVHDPIERLEEHSDAEEHE
jgi:exodeoxyribonuclease VII large subunit